MKKLLELETQLRKAKEDLEKQAVNSAPGGGTSSIASQIGWPGANKSEGHMDEEEDKKIIAEALDDHNEKKHGEDKDKDSAFKDMKVKKAEEYFKAEMCKFDKNGQWSLEKANSMAESREKNLDPAITTKPSPIKVLSQESNGVQMMAPELKKSYGDDKKASGMKSPAAKQQAVDTAIASTPQPAKVTNVKTGEVKTVTPAENEKAKVTNAASKKAQFEIEAKARRDKLRSEGVLKSLDERLDDVLEILYKGKMHSGKGATISIAEMKQKAIASKAPVKVYTKEEIAQINAEKQKEVPLKKEEKPYPPSLPFKREPDAEEEESRMASKEEKAKLKQKKVKAPKEDEED